MLREMIGRGLERMSKKTMTAATFFLRDGEWPSKRRETGRPYAEHPWVYAASNYVARNIAQLPFNLVRPDGKPASTSTASADLFVNPNPNISRFQLWESTVIHMILEGECFWWLDFGTGRRFPEDIWILNARRYKEKISTDGRNRVLGWELVVPTETGTQTFNLAPEEVVHFKFYNPYHPVRGLSPITAARLPINSDLAAAEFNKSLLENNAEAGVVLSTDKDLKPEQVDTILSRWRTRHSGPRGVARPALLTSGLKYEKNTMSSRDMQWMEMKRMNREEEVAVIGVPPELMGFGKTTFANREEADRAFWKMTCRPLTVLLVEALASKFFGIYEPSVRGIFDLSSVEALQDDFSKKVDDGYKMWQMGWPINAINKRLGMGMEDVAWGNDWWINALQTPAGGLIGNSAGAQALAFWQMQAKQVGAFPQASAQPADPGKQIFIRSLINSEMAKRFVDMVAGIEKDQKEKITKMWFAQRGRVLKALAGLSDIPKKADALVRKILDVEAEAAHLLDVLKPLWEESATAGADAVQRDFHKGKTKAKPSEFVQNNIKLAAYMRKKSKMRPADLMDTTERSLVTSLAEGLAAEETMGELADRVRAVYNEARNFAASVARTEVVESANMGRIAMMDEQGFTMQQWITANDEHVRPTHQHNEEIGPIPIGDLFPNGLAFPGDSLSPSATPGEYYNCRCSTSPVEEGQ